MFVETDFDRLLNEDVSLEENDQTAEFANILQNSENILKSFMYIKKMFGMSVTFNKLVKVYSIEDTVLTDVITDAASNYISIKSVADQKVDVFINGGKYILLPFEDLDFPIETGMTIAVSGQVSILETYHSL